jgi:L-threonylcarbamoyladenylate synthase
MPISTNIIKASDPSALSRATEVLGNGGVVAIPTETVYGLAAAIDNQVSLNKIFAVKGRPTSHPLIAHLSSLDELHHWATDVSPDAMMLVEACWPGPLSVLLHKSERLPYLVTGNRETAVFRIPANNFSRQLISAVGVPIAAPSANRFGKVSPTTAQHVVDDLGSDVDLIIDGGACSIGVESTIIDFTTSPPQMLRPGGFPQEDLEMVLGKQLSNQEGESRASGMLQSHYAPRCKIVIADDILQANQLLKQQLALGTRAQIVRFSDDLPIYASSLYAQMREADRANLEVLIAVTPQVNGLGPAILDRLSKASALRL